MANQSAENLLSSILPDIEYADAPQDYCDLELSILQDMDPKFNCMRLSLAPSETCPAEVPPAIAGQLQCDEQCPERRKTPFDLTAENVEPAPPAKVMRRAA